MIVQKLFEIQHAHGYLPERELLALAARTGIKLHRLHEVASFYPHFKLKPPAPIQVQICQDMSCQLRGSWEILKNFTEARDGSKSKDVEVQGVSCLGRCDRAPATCVSALVHDQLSGSNSDLHCRQCVNFYLNTDQPKLDSVLHATRNAVQKNDPSAIPAGDSDRDWFVDAVGNWEIDPYAAGGPSDHYRAVKQWIERQGKPEIIVDQFRLKNNRLQYESCVVSTAPFSTECFAGKVLLIVIWKLDCALSQQNIGQASELYTLFAQGKDRNSNLPYVASGLNLLGINVSAGMDSVAAITNGAVPEWLHLTDADARGICEAMSLPRAPAVVLVGADGRVIASASTVAELEVTILKQLLSTALRAPLDANLDNESQRILCSLFTANLLGMGGAGGRTYKKWLEVFQAKGGTKYVVCNGDESEPGTFKDREILLHAPHLVVEAVILAGLILKAQRGYIYIRHEFEEQIESVRAEIRRAEELGVCGQNIFVGTGQPNRSFSVEVFVSPGGYICGEQTALIEAMENKRAEPRNRPPELQTNGLWDCPTLLNNVETFAWVPTIVLRGNGKWFAGRGVSPGRELKGRRFFSISGDVTRPGPYEVPIGIRLRDLIDQYAGGMIAGEPVKAVALSGPSGGFLPRQIPIEFLNSRWVARKLPPETTHFDCLDIELDIQVTRDMGVMLGAGIVIFGDSTDMVAAALSATRFYRNESCGKCVPCRIGSQKLVELLTVVSERKYSMADIYGDSETTCGRKQLIDELAETMKLTSICGLGTVASNPITSLLNYFREDVIRYTTDDVQRFS